MLLTKDNLKRFVREKRYTIPSEVASEFETSTMIASAALSELTKDSGVKVTHLKLSSSPYYYDSNQREALQELAEKHFSSTEKNLYENLKQSQIINEISLTIPQKLSMEKIKDFYEELEISNKGKDMKFFVWYLRDLKETKKQIMDYLKDDSPSASQDSPKKEIKKENTSQLKVEKKIEEQEVKSKSSFEGKQSFDFEPQEEIAPVKVDKVQEFIEGYLHKNYLKIEEIDKVQNGTLYCAILRVNSLEVSFDCMYFSKKPQEADLVKFYTSSMKPKIVFVENAPKKLFKLAENLENLEVVNI